MFFDWLACHQDYDFDLPIISEGGWVRVDFFDGTQTDPRQFPIEHEGSFDTSIKLRVTGRRLQIMRGNPSRFNRLDNLFGYSTLEQCIAVYNGVLDQLGLPPLTRCTKLFRRTTVNKSASMLPDDIPLEEITFQDIQASKKDWDFNYSYSSDGCVIDELHVTSNVAVGGGGGGQILTYLKALSSQSYRHMAGYLHPNGRTVDWRNAQTHKASRLIYAGVYDKAFEMLQHLLPKVKRKFGFDSDECRYVMALIDYCESQGTARFEQKLKGEFLRRENLQFWGISDYSRLHSIHTEFLNIDQRLKVSHMDIMTIAQTLLAEGICSNTKAANTTAMYAYNWQNGQVFNLSNSNVQTHRSRLRKIGIDIARPCNILTFSPVIIRNVTEIEKRPLVAPSFYRHPAPVLRAVGGRG